MVTAQKALQSGYWWPTLFTDAARYVKKCDPCQRVGKLPTSKAMPLNLILVQVLFEKWGIDLVVPIKPPSRYGKKQYILVASEYVTKWAETLATKTDDAKTVAKFLYENIITRFGCPKELVSDRGTHFLNKTIEQLTTKYLIKHRKSTPYHPRANGQTEKTNGILCKIITKTVQGSNNDWDARIHDTLWAYRTAYKVTNETRAEAYLNTVAIQNQRKSFYDSKLSPKTLNPNDLVLLYDSRFQKFPGKFKMRWFGPYRVLRSYPNGSVELQDFAGVVHSTRYNGYRLKKYVT